jgi:hypothetical protein
LLARHNKKRTNQLTPEQLVERSKRKEREKREKLD